MAAREYVYKKLLDHNIVCRKYWYPLITSHSHYKKYKISDLSNAKKIKRFGNLLMRIYPSLGETRKTKS